MTCETCVYYDSIDDFKFFCDVHGVGLKDDLTPCRQYVPVEGAEEENEVEE